MAYQIPGFALLISALIGAIVILAAPRERLWAMATVASAAVTVSMVVSYISLSV